MTSGYTIRASWHASTVGPLFPHDPVVVKKKIGKRLWMSQLSQLTVRRLPASLHVYGG